MSVESFDYIIVGAGSAGCVLADRLSASGRYTVLVIEAGGSDRRFWIRTPMGYGKTFNDPRVNWRYSAEADAGLNGREAYWPRGRVLGGSSSINAMAYLRGLPHDFDDWEKAGATGWNWESVRQTYEAIETQSNPGDTGGAGTVGDGPVWVGNVDRRTHPFSQHFLAAAREMGWATPPHLNSAETEGLALLRATVRSGRRWSAADAFLRPALARANVKLVSGALVEQVVLEGNQATGVRYRLGGASVTAQARGEVILSAGAVNSPQLLQLSGIGPAPLLQQLGIEIRHALSQVGQGLQDHLGVSHFFRSTEPTLNNRLGNWVGQMMAGAQYLLTKGGPLSVPVNQVSGFVRSDAAQQVADLQIYCNPMSYVTDADGNAGVDPEPGFLLCAQPCRPTSRGEIAITSADPTQAPAIRPNSLSTNEDCEMAIKAGRVVQALSQTPAIRAVTRERLTLDAIDMTDDALLEDFRNRAGTVFHPTCTCRMGADPDSSVLDAQLRVHGVTGLRVVDASSFPNVTSGNTNAPVMMLAARGADLILEDAGQALQAGGTP